MRIAHIVANLEARQGGPSRSVLSLAQAQATSDGDDQLLTTDREEESFLSGHLMVKKFRRVCPESISRSSSPNRHLQQNPFDVIHTHSLWLRPRHYARQSAQLHNVPRVLSPRGIRSAGAWNHHRRRKFWPGKLIHLCALEAARGWHAASASEAKAFRDLGFKQPICVAPNAVDLPTAKQREIAHAHWIKRAPHAAQPPVALFYSRFHRKKGVIELIDLWHQVAPRDWLLLLVGTPDQLSVARLETYIVRQGVQKPISVFDGTAQPPPYVIAQLFILPTHSENFGLVVAESLANGVPPLVTDITPWSEINEVGAGWWVPWQDFAETVRLALTESDTERKTRGETGRQWTTTQSFWHDTASGLRKFYRQIH